MARVKRATTARRRHAKVLKEAKGFWGARHRHFRRANEALLKARHYAYRDRRVRKRDFRRLWVTRINAAARSSGITYSRLTEGLKKAGLEINRKSLADMAVNDMGAFEDLVRIAKEKVAGAQGETGEN